MVSTAAFHARVRGSVPGLGGLKKTEMFLPHPLVKLSIVGSLCYREVACSASDRQGANFESCVWRTVSSHSPHHPHEVLLAQFSLYVHKGGFFFFTISSQVMSLGFRGTNISGALGLGTGPIGSDVNTALDCSDSTSALSSSELANAVETCFSLIQLYMIWVFFNFD